MDKDLELYLEILNSARCLKKPKEAIVILDKITKCFTQEKSQFTLSLLISLLLNEENALFNFIWKMSAEFETVSAVSAAFKLLDYVVTNYQKSIEPYFPFLFQKCLSLLSTKFAKVKESSLKLIRKIIIADSKQTLELSKLISAFEKYLREEIKIPGTVLDQIYSLLGYLFEKHPESVKFEKWFFNKMCDSVRQESSVKNLSANCTKGAFEGINGYLTNFPPPDGETLLKTYEYVKNWSKFREERKAISRAALKILQNHWSHFSHFIYNDKEFWRINMEVWIKLRNEDQEYAFKFLCAFYSVIALFIKQKPDNLEIKNYLKEFTSTLESDANFYEKKAALVGIKLFVLTGSLPRDDFNKTYDLLENFIKKQETQKYFSCLPLGMECVSAFVLRFSDESFLVKQLAFLQRLSVKLIENYPNFETEFQADVLTAFEKSFYMLGLSNLQVMEKHVDGVLYQGLIRTCSSLTVSELELLEETGQSSDSVYYKSYLGLWKYFLTLASSPNLPIGGSFTLKKGVAVKVFDAFVNSFLKVLSKLNLSVDSKVEIEKPSDFHIFINIVDLFQDLTPLVDPFNFQKWLIEIFKTVIHLSDMNPLVSGFYRIAAMSIKVADCIQFFDDCTNEKKNCFMLMHKFLESILAKIDQFKGDLQVACLKVLLVAPVNVLEGFIDKIVPILEVIIQLSRNSSSLLKDLIEALERWDFSLLPETSKIIMESILPHFDIFFQSPYFCGKNSVNWSKAGKKVKNTVVFTDSEFLALQKKFLLFLGNLEISKSLKLIELPHTEEIRHISDKPLVYYLPCCDGLVELNLEELIPRVIDLAQSCGDRKTRITACELLYSLVLLILGNINQLNGGYTYFFRKVVKACVMLGCDSDRLVWQIFEPLMYQITHYFSGKEALHFLETKDLIDILTDFVTCPYNPTIRDFSAFLLREFTVWSIKQLTPEELKVTPESVKRILQKIHSLALHPSYNKRLGAAVLFNKIYSILREEDFILNAYWFELFYYFMESLRMCEGSENVMEITEAIEHVKRPLIEKCKEFNENSCERIIPPEFKGGRLCHLVKWTMEWACDIKPHTRHIAMALVQDLAPLVENCDSDMFFVSKQLQNFFQLKENSFHSDFKDDEFLNWLSYQNAGFEYCTWLLQQNVLTTDELFQPKFKEVLKQFISGILSHGESRIASNNLKQQSTLSFLKLLYALKEKAYLFPSEHWIILKTAIFKSSFFGFDLNQASSTEQLFSVLTDLLKYLSVSLTVYDWDNFYANVESVITAPVFNHISKNQSISIENLEFLFSLKVIESSGLWNTFTEKIFYSMKEDLFLLPIFKALFFEKEKTVHAITLEPSCKFYFEEVLKVILKGSADLKGLMYCLENDEKVQEDETGKTIKKGEFFQLLFKNVIFKFLESKHGLLIEWVLNHESINGVKLLVQILENQSDDSDFPLDIFVRWQDFENINFSDESQKNKILFRLAVCGARLIGTPGFLKTSSMADKIYFILENHKLEEIDFYEIEAIVHLLPFLSVFAEGPEENDRLHACLSKIQIDLHALKKLNDPFYFNRVHFVLGGLLQSLKITASLVVLNFIMSRTNWFNFIFQKKEIESALSVFAENRTPLICSMRALELAYSYCFEYRRTDFLPSVFYESFFYPLLRLTPNPTVYNLMQRNIHDLCQILTTHWESATNSMNILINMSRIMCGARVFQTFITKLTKDELDKMSKKKRQLMVLMVRKMFFFLKKPYPPLQLKERYRKLMCEIFNMICCIVSARCVDEKFYKLFIFDERGSFLFETIDKTVKYNFEMDFDEIPERKKHLTILRKGITKESQECSSKDSIKYIQTNTLFTSSLREDVTRFDLTFSIIRPMDFAPEKKTKNVEIELEMDSLNKHECMATLVATVSKMVHNEIVPIDEINNMPCWLKFFLSVLQNSSFCENLKLFVLKAIYNVQEFVTPFCEKIFPHLLVSISELFHNHPINYFLFDLVEMMLGWKHVPEKEKSRLELTELVALIMSKSDFLRWDIIKYYLEVLKIIIEVWKSGLFLPRLSSLVFKRLAKSIEKDLKANRNDDSELYLNIHTCGILLSNGIPAWKEGFEKQFFNFILKCFENENKHNELFGEICGLALKHLQNTNRSALGEIEELVQKKISSQTVSWMQLLYGVHKHYPKISSLFTFKIFSSAWDSTDSLTIRKLEMLLSHVSGSEIAEDPTFDRHAWAFILDMLNSPDAAVHELSLQIADKLLNKLDSDKFKVFMMEITRLQKSVHPGVRKWVYEICKKLYQGVPCEFILKQCRIILLSGLNDDVQTLEEFCVEFWQCALNFTSPGSALLKILKEMYTSETEDFFLSSTAKILLRFFADDYRSKASIFPHPITHRCKFRKRNLVLGPRQSFLLSLSSSGRTLRNESLEHLATINYDNFTYLRPSLSSLKFQPTVQESWEESSAPVVSTRQDCLMPTNPSKRRFCKKEAKTYFSSMRWQKQKKKKEDDEELTRNKESEVDIYGEYRESDYPDIQIPHSQIIKLLEVLSKRDYQIAKLFLVSFFSGLVKTLKSDEKVGFLSEASDCFERVLKSSANFDPGVIGFIFQVILKHRQLDINCQLISNAAISSNWISLGVLIIEQVIGNSEGEDDEIPKKRREFEHPEDIRWLELAKLYRSLEEFDVLTGIFLDKLRVVGDARDAILCETASNWQEALKLYESVLRTKPESSEREFYTESYLLCLAKLSNWSSLNNCVRTTVNNDLNDLWNNYNILSWFLKSEMMISLGTDKNDFKKILEEFCKKSVRENILSSNFGEEMTVFDWFSNNLQRASYRINKLCLDFLADWSHLDQWSYNLRAAKLLKLQTLSELSFAVRSLAGGSKSDLEQNIKLGLKRWEKNVPSSRDDLTIWDVKLCYRREFFKRLKDFDLRAVEVKSNLALARAALSQYNLYMAKEYLSRAKEKLPADDFDLRVEYNICFNLGKMALAKLRMKDVNVGLEVYLNVWNGISKQISSAMETDSDSYNALAFSCNFILGQLISDMLPCVKKQTVSPDILNSLCLKLKSSEDELVNSLRRKGLEYFEIARRALENEDCSPEIKSNTYLELCKFFLKFPDSELQETLCKYLLRSMCLGNSEARQLFGCVLNMPHPITEQPFSFEDIILESERVPPWMFLMWTNQMLASLNSKMFPFLRSILLRVTQSYPNAMRYALKLTEESKSYNPKTRSFLIRLYSIVSKDKIYDEFWNSLRYLAPPHLILNYYLEEALQEASHAEPNLQQIKRIILSLQELMFSESCSKFRGPIFKFWDKFKEPLEDILTEFENQEVLKMKIKNMMSSLDHAKLPSRRVLGLLESYSPWLYKFHALKSDETLELPGQYDGSREPIKKSLVMISSFKNSVFIYDSKCRPIRISILGNDAKEHKFLVKFGEDLRQDERIQQVFQHFNHRLKISKQTSKLCLDTYKVIPLTLSLGLIEWVEDNVSLYEMVENSLGNESDAIVKAQRTHLTFLSQGSPLVVSDSIKGTVAAHLMAYEIIPRERAISNFRLRVNEFPNDLLKKSFLSLSSSSEHFVYLRGNFAVSHAIVCITHWLIGIGDRHLQNILVSKKTGRVLGIDFGYAFGLATQFLTPPELIPFRLSPQILNLMHPLGESGSMKQTMIHCLRIFRENSFRLRSVLEVFAQEPIMDWLKQIKKKPNYKSENPDTWYPREKLSLVEKKLNGVNPVVAFEADLRAGHSEEKYLSKYLEVLKGVQRDNIRARCNEDGLTEEEQVECLIDLATDPHVLSKTYIGWNPWL